MNKILIFLLLFFSTQSYAQTFGNEWIEYSQKYYSFKIWKDGVYKIDYTTLVNANIPLNSISSNNLQIFGFEKEQPILVVDGNDGSFDNGDYILFYAQKNTSWLDTVMFMDGANNGNKYYPLYNDTITYFLTWNNLSSNNRMIVETDVNYSNYSPSSYFYKTNYISFSNVYNIGYDILGVSYSHYHEAEGWSSSLVNALSANNFIDANVPTPFAYTASGAPNVTGEAVSMSGSNASSNALYNHHLQLSYGNSFIVLHDVLFDGFKRNKLAINFPASAITSNTTKIRHTFVNDLSVPADQQAVSYVELTYPHQPNLEGTNHIKITVKNNTSQSKTRLDLTNFNSATPYAFALDNGLVKKLPVTNNSGTYQVIIPNSNLNSEQDVLFIDGSQILSINQINPVNGTGTFTNFSVLNYDKSYLIITNKKLQNSANNYKLYRQSPQGGSRNVIIAYQDELNMQFGGGIPKHAMGLRRFQHYAYSKAIIDKPEHVFLLGKGVREANENQITYTQGTRKNITSYNYCLVPTFGYPASDAIYTHHLDNNGWAPLIPIGRLAAKSNLEVNTYLNKVVEFEAAQDSLAPYTLPSKYWQKNILHFGGGGTTAEQNTFKTYLEIFEQTLEGPKFGGNVTSYHKNVSDPIDPVVLYDVTDKINEGVSIMTYFGHAYAGGFDLNVDNPDNWDNQGKYPFLFSNSCLAGNIHEPFDYNYSSSEIFTLLENKGCIAFLANTRSAFSNGLYSLSNQLFINLSQNHYGESIGEIIKYTMDDLQSGSYMPFTTLTAMTQYTLHGDPALRVNPHPKPELEINISDFWVSPYPIDLTNDSIDVNIVIHNMGQSAIDTFAIELTRSFPNNNGDSTYIQFVPGINYNDTVIFTIPLYANIGAGINSFTVKVDQPSVIDEVYDEYNNNVITKQILFDIDGIMPVWPYNYAVVPNDTVTLKASTLNPFASSNTYRFEIDTTDTYDSPFHKFTLKTSLGGVIETDFDEWISTQTNSSSELILTDSTVYFWRVSVEDPTNYNWIEYSFQYIPNKSGWGQDHFFQFKNNDFNDLNYDRPSRELTFGPAGKTISCDVYGNAVIPQVYYTQWEIAGSQQEYGICSYSPAFMVCVVDHVTLTSWGSRVWDATSNTWINPTHNFGNANDGSNCRNRVEKYFVFFQNDSLQMANMQDMILNQVPDSDYVLIYTSRFIDYPEWNSHNPELYTFFQNLGSDSVFVGQTNVPYICFFKKGDQSTFEEVYADNLNDFITFDGFMFGKDYNGHETSTLIGPSTNWKTVYWKQNPLENPTTDNTRLKIFGIEFNGTESLLIDTLFSSNDSILNFNSLYSAQSYPYLRLQSHQIDTVDFTPAQIDSWHVLYDHVPESALTSVNGYYLSPTDTLDEGQDLYVAFDVTNISDLPMDSILINYWIEDDEHNIIPLPYPRQDSLRVGQIIRDTLEIQSLGLKNLNSLWVEINPYVNLYQTDQLEQYHFNNIGQIPFYVNNDNINPILDVTFNGYHILNGDIVSPQSEIVISLKDENQYLIMDSETDTSYFGIYLTDPNGVQKRLNFRNSAGEPLMDWIPADESNKKFKIIYNGNFDLDGTYRLLVQGSDKSGNVSGDFEYDIEFEVDHKSTITALMNYPNPFSTQTQFVFTLTGAVIPDEFTIQIMTISGKVVREITIDELGSIHIGRNITDYRWDGRDEYGDILANGIYLYRVITKINGEEIEHRDSGADEYITKGFGKMYIIR